MLKPLVDQFIIENPDAKVKDIRHWLKSNKPPQGEDLPCVATLAIKGSPEIQGTYFNYSLVSQVLAWVSVDLKQMIFKVFENATVEQNQIL